MSFFTHDQLVAAYRKRPALAAEKADEHRRRAAAARLLGEYDQAVHHWDRVDIYHAVLDELVRCRRCGRHLTNPESVERHIGPECWAKEQSPDRCQVCDGAGIIAAPDPVIGGTIDIDCVCIPQTLPGTAR